MAKEKYPNNCPNALYEHVVAHGEKGNLSNVIATIDKYCWNEKWHMNVGDVKGEILDRLIEEQAPKTLLELGTYLGYSGLRTVRKMPPDAVLYTIEVNPEHAQIARKIFEFAGVGDRVKVLEGDSGEFLKKMKREQGVDKFDFVFIDHWKNLYKRDLIILEDEKLLKKGSVVLADNVVYPGAPEYLEYVRNNPKYKCENFPSKLEYVNEEDDALEKSTYLVD